MPTRRPLSTSLATISLSAGLVLVAYYGKAWYGLPQYSEADIAASTELNLQMDMQRFGPHQQPDANQREELRRQIRAEIDGEIRKEREWVRGWLLMGAAMSLIGAIWLAPGIAKGIKNR